MAVTPAMRRSTALRLGDRSLCKSDLAVLASMINAAFRLPDVSVRERSRSISKYPAYASVMSTLSKGIPPDHDADSTPPFISSIQAGTVASFPLKYSHAEAYLGEDAGSRTVLAVDAAHTIHPLAGQGLNLGLETQTLRHSGDIGPFTALRPYATLLVDARTDRLGMFSGPQGVERVDTVKAALMMDAGGGRSTRSGWEWDLLAAEMSAARMVTYSGANPTPAPSSPPRPPELNNEEMVYPAPPRSAPFRPVHQINHRAQARASQESSACMVHPLEGASWLQPVPGPSPHSPSGMSSECVWIESQFISRNIVGVQCMA
ncbi:hypothetical protein EV363DRAFT_1301871 [Boletus edulis]|nr:hypothetical protein EV363DRAFT_1301871 [Boletus edulis]